jgi:hypothetical protein
MESDNSKLAALVLATPPNRLSIARRVATTSAPASISTSSQRTTAPWTMSFFSFTRCANPDRQRAGFEARRRRHQFAPHGVAAFAVEHFAGSQVALGHRGYVAAEFLRLPGRLAP